MQKEEIILKSENELDFLDITDKVNSILKNLKIEEGFIHLFNMHTTAGLWVNELESGLIHDMKCFIKKMVPSDCYYKHDDLAIRTQNIEPEERKNGWSHIQSSFFSSFLTLPVENFELRLGTWQRVFFVELDGPQERKVLLQVCGDD